MSRTVAYVDASQGNHENTPHPSSHLVQPLPEAPRGGKVDRGARSFTPAGKACRNGLQPGARARCSRHSLLRAEAGTRLTLLAWLHE